MLLINDKIVNQDKFSYKPTSKLDIEKEVKLINPKKVSTSDSILPKILKIISEASADILHNFFSDLLKTGNFPGNLKLADINPVFRRKNPLHNVNYRPVSVLSNNSKVLEKLMQKQITGYISNYLSHYLCRYRKGFSSQQDLLSLIENWKKILDEKGFGQAFNTIKHNLLIGKFYAYGFNKESKFLHSYLSKKWH